jgi:hypothetical protein
MNVTIDLQGLIKFPLTLDLLPGWTNSELAS